MKAGSILLGHRYRIRFKTKVLKGNPKLDGSNGIVLAGTASGGMTPVLGDEVFVGEQSWDFETSVVDTTPADRLLFYFAGDDVGHTDWEILIDDVFVEEIPPLPTLDVGTKYLECTSAGTVAWASDQAYGTWEFDLYKGVSTNVPFVYFITDSLKLRYNLIGYIFSLGISSSNYSILLRVDGDGSSANDLFETVDNYINTVIWYRIKITRTLDGEFYTYIKGGDFGISDWTLMVKDTGQNPVTDNTYTESKYFVLDFDAGDRIANIITRKGVSQ